LSLTAAIFDRVRAAMAAARLLAGRVLVRHSPAAVCNGEHAAHGGLRRRAGPLLSQLDRPDRGPDSAWSLSAIGFLAPAWTPLVWLLGLALLMQRLQWPSPYRWWHYLALSIAFLAAHIGHCAIVFSRLPVGVAAR
jgi:hypothetical protein